MRFFKTGSFEGIPWQRMQGTKVTIHTSENFAYLRMILRCKGSALF